jgi:ssDNA-binding Zn-finger/Zn-ribbon topoisomerase 1
MIDITKANKHKINRDDIETLHKCSECGKNNKLYWSEQKKRFYFLFIL